MDEITLSIMRNTRQTEPTLVQVLQAYEASYGTRVQLQMLAWETARQEVLNFALHQRGPDLSGMATTWTPDLVAMNAVQLLNKPFLYRLDHSEDFVTSSVLSNSSDLLVDAYAAPWMIDSYIIHYRRDLLEKAGVDPALAFTSLERLDETVGRLSQSGMDCPIQLPFEYDRFCLLHTMAAWVWGHGAEFCTPDGSRMIFDQPEALAGMRDYFNLARHISPRGREMLSAPNNHALFRSGQAAIAFGTRSFLYAPEEVDPQVRQNWRAVPIPGPHFVGGVNLVVWKYMPNEFAALDLIRYLNSPPIVTRCSEAMLTSPARISVLQSPEYAKDALLDVITQSALTGRSYLPARLWGLVEERLTEVLIYIGSRLLQSPDLNLDDLLRETIKPVTRRLNLTLAS